MTVPPWLYMTAAKQFRRPFQVRVACPHLCNRLRRVLHNACITVLTYHLSRIWEAPSAHPWLTCRAYTAQQGGPRAFGECPHHCSGRGSPRGAEGTSTKCGHCLSAFSHPVQDKDVNTCSHGVDYLTACAEEYNLASLLKQNPKDPLPHFISPALPCSTLNTGSWLPGPWGEDCPRLPVARGLAVAATLHWSLTQ